MSDSDAGPCRDCNGSGSVGVPNPQGGMDTEEELLAQESEPVVELVEILGPPPLVSSVGSVLQ